MSMQCCGEKRGSHIVVRKGCEKGESLVESCGCFPMDLRCYDRVLRKMKCCDMSVCGFAVGGFAVCGWVRR
jgi:hypothetical protein